VNLKVFITIDTEEDTWSDYKAIGNKCDNISQIQKIQELFDRYGAIPTYLVSYPVVTDGNSVNILRDIVERKRCEIGMHCHLWNTPPFEEDINNHSSMIYKLPKRIMKEKLEAHHEAITKGFKLEPVCFRADRKSVV
jgi:hypothetical protein